MNAKETTFYKPLYGFPNYGLRKGDRVTVLKGSGCQVGEPDWVEVVEEFPTYIVLEYFFTHWMGYVTSYKHCINKALLISGDASVQLEAMV